MALFEGTYVPALDDNASPVSGARWEFSLSGTTTPIAVYSDSDLTVSLGATVTADSSGRFVPIFYDGTIQMRARLVDAGGALIGGSDIDPINGTSTVAFRVENKTELAALVDPVAGQLVLLSDATIGGMFRFSSSDLSAVVALDTGKGVYVAPAAAPTGASGAWVRQVPDSIYLAVWFGVNAVSLANETFYNSAGAVLPDGATLLIPPFTHMASAKILFKPGKAIHLRGVDPIASHIAANPAALATFVDDGLNASLVHLAGSKSTAKDFTLTGPVNNVPVGEPPALTLGKLYYLDGITPVYGICEDMVADNITILAGSAGIRVGGYLRAKAGAPTGTFSQNWTHYDVLYRAVVRNCNITADRAGIEYYATIDTRDENNTITLNYVADTGVFCATVRVMGSQSFFSTGLIGKYTQEHASNISRFGIYIAEAGFNDRYWGPSNAGVVVKDCHFTNASQGAYLGSTETDGDIIIDGMVMNNPITSVNQFSTVLASSLFDVAARVKRCEVRNVTARGVANAWRIEMPFKHLRIQDFDMIQNAITADTSNPLAKFLDFQSFVGTVGGFGMIEMERVKIRSARVTYGEFTIGGMVATSKVIASDCWTSPDGGAGFTQFIRTGTNAAGSKLITDGATEQALDGAVPLTSGLNYRYPTGARGLVA